MTKVPFTIEEATENDAEALLEYLHIVGGESHNLTFGSEGRPITIEAEKTILANYRKHQINTIWCAKTNGTIIGNLAVEVPDRKRMAHRASFGISVRKDYWHQGIATALMETMMAHVRSIPSITMIAMEVISDNERAIALYERFGFQICGQIHKLFLINGTYYDAYMMECDLTKQTETENNDDYLTGN